MALASNRLRSLCPKGPKHLQSFTRGFPKIRGYPFGGPHKKDHNILGSILGSPFFGKLPHKFLV